MEEIAAKYLKHSSSVITGINYDKNLDGKFNDAQLKQIRVDKSNLSTMISSMIEDKNGTIDVTKSKTTRNLAQKKCKSND